MELSRRFPTVIFDMAWNGRDGFCLIARNGPDPLIIRLFIVSSMIQIFSKHSYIYIFVFPESACEGFFVKKQPLYYIFTPSHLLI